MSEEKLNIISYHTFVFPFLWDQGGKVTRKGFEKKLIENTNWQKDILDPDAVPDRETYAQQQYFNHAARNAMFVRKDDTQAAVHNYRYDFGKIIGDDGWLASDKDHTNPVHLLLEKESNDFRVGLSVRGVRLKLYNTGVGLLLFELSNYAVSGEENINKINEYGRRLFMPYVNDDGSCGDCVDRMLLRMGSAQTVESCISGRPLTALDDVPLPELIRFLLSKGEYTVTANRKREKKTLFIEPIIDDRMFTMCYYVDGAFVADMAKWDAKQGCYAYLADAQSQRPGNKENLAHRMYRMMFVDGNGLTCHARPMIAELLEKNLFTRWLEYTYDDACAGTVTGITEYSMVTVSTGSFVAETAFLPEYVEMACLVLAQRASLLAFEKRISESAKGKASISKIQRSYVIFQGQLLLREVTPQQQGIELYDLLLEQLMIQKEAQEIEAQLNAMFALEQTTQQQQESLLLGILAFFTVFDGIRFFVTENNGLWTRLISAGVVTAMLLVYLLVRKRRIK